MIVSAQNMLPPSIITARRVRIRLAFWTRIIIAVLMLALGIGLALHILAPGPTASQLHAHDSLVIRETELKEDLRKHAADLAEVTRRSKMTERITTRPDWGVLLAAISKKRDEHVVLTGFDIDDGDTVTSVGVVLTGMGLTQAGIQQFVLELENADLFEEVIITETRRTLTREGERLAFSIHAEMTAENRTDKGQRTIGTTLVAGEKP